MSLTPFKNSHRLSQKRSRQSVISSPAVLDTENLSPVDDGVFGQLVFRSGIGFTTTGQPILKVDQAVFQRDLASALKSHPGYPKVVENFLDGFRNCIDDIKKFWWFVNSTKTGTSCTSARSGRQDALARLLLGVTHLQSGVASILLEKLAEMGPEDEETIFEEGDIKQIPKLILFQLRWLGTLVNSKEMCNKLLEIFAAVSIETQKEIIACIPEILEDEDHETVAKAWNQLLKENVALTVSILDALPNLCVSTEVMTEVKSSMVQTIESVELNDLPVIVKFLLHELAAEDAKNIIQTLRTTLNFNGSCAVQDSGTKDDGKKSYQVLTLEVFKTAIESQKLVGDTIFKLLESLNDQNEQFRLPDFLFLLLLLSVTSRKKAAETLATSGLRCGTFTSAVVKIAFRQYMQVCSANFSTIRLLAFFLLQSNDASLRKFGAFLYKTLFSKLDGPGDSQEIVESLIMHALSSQSSEIDCGLGVLEDLVVKYPDQMSPYGVFLKGLLGSIESMTLPKVRKVYTILGHLSKIGDTQGHGLHDDLHITIQKQLSNSYPKYCRMGAVGSVAALKVSLSTEDSSGLNLKSACRRLETIEKGVAKFPNIRALYFDDLAVAIIEGRLTIDLEEWLAERYTTDFQDNYVTDAVLDSGVRVHGFRGELKFALEDITEESIAINILSIVDSDLTATSTSKYERASISCLLSEFRVARLSTQAVRDNNLENIDALLSCALHFFSTDVLDKFDSSSNSEQRFICHCFFAAINWFIEVINAFVSQKEPDIKTKVLLRLRQLIKMRNTLVVYLSVVQHFTPLIVHFDVDEDVMAGSPTKGSVKVSPTVEPKAPKRKVGGKVIRNKISNVDAPSQPLDTQPACSLAEKLTKKKVEKTVVVNLSSYALGFRELEFRVMSLLKYELVLTPKDQPDAYLEIGDLLFLAEDLLSKLKVTLVSDEPVIKRGFPSKKLGQAIALVRPVDRMQNKNDPTVLHKVLLLQPPLVIAKMCVKLLPSLLRHLKTIVDHVKQASIEEAAEDDDMMDTGLDDSFVSSEKVGKVLRIILGIFEALIGWSGFESPEERPILNKIFEIFSECSGTDCRLDRLIKKTFAYFLGMIDAQIDFASEVALIHVLEAVAKKYSKNKLKNSLAEATLVLLKKSEVQTSRMSSEKLSTHKNFLFDLLSIYFKYSSNVLNALEDVVVSAIPELLESSEKGHSSATYLTLTRDTLPTYYRAMQISLITFVQKEYDPNDMSNEEILNFWCSVVKIFQVLVKIIKEFDIRQNIAICLKNGRNFLDLFLRKGLPALSQMFGTETVRVQGLLKSLQSATRFLHHICNHSKVKKDVSLTNQVPPLRKVLEEFVYRVRDMLVRNKCKEFFWVGNLKNRNLQGVEILSQKQNDNESGDDHDADENQSNAESENELSDMEVGNQSDAEDDGNISESY